MTPLDLRGKICGKQLDDLENLATTVANQHGESQVKQFLAALRESTELHEIHTQHRQQSYNFKYQGLAFQFEPAFYSSDFISIRFLGAKNMYDMYGSLEARYLYRVAHENRQPQAGATPLDANDEHLIEHMNEYHFTIDVNDFDASLANWFKAWVIWLKANTTIQGFKANHEAWQSVINRK